MKKNRKRSGKRSVCVARRRMPSIAPSAADTPEAESLVLPNGEVMLSLANRLPAVQNLIALGWHKFLPPELAVTFLGCAIAAKTRYRGDELWRELNEFVEGVVRFRAGEEAKPVIEFIDKRFRDYYGEYERTPMGLIKTLIDLGLVVLKQEEGQDVLEIPSQLPTPEKRLNLCMADRDEQIVLKARYRDDAGPRQRVYWDEIPAIKRMMNAGWARHLPPDIAIAFMVAAAVSIGHCTGTLMWENIEDLWKAQKEQGTPLMPKRKELEVEDRFRAEYGKPFIRTARGCVEVLLELGLLVLRDLDGEDFLEVPDVLPTPDMKLYLSEEEKGLLAERLKISI